MNAHLHGDIGFLLSRASGRIVRGTNAALAPTGLRARAYAVLLLVCEQPSGLTQRVIADSLGLAPSQIVALISEGVNESGTTCLRSVRVFVAPIDTAAATCSRCLIDITWPRINRA